MSGKMDDMLQDLKKITKEFKKGLRKYQLIYNDPRTPKRAKALLWLAIGYTLMPFDLIPDFIPVFGQIDDLIIVPALVVLALKFVPVEVVRDSERMAGVD